MASESNDDISFDYDENETIDDDEVDSILSGESGKRDKKRNIPDINLYKLLTKRRKCIHFCFRKIIMISFIPTLVYNLFWIIILKTITFENLINFDFNNFKNIIIKACYIVLAKGIFILFLPQLFCGSEQSINDFSYTCVFLKTVTTFIISVFLTRNMKKNFDFKNSSDMLNSKYDLYYWLKLYYEFECIYIKGIIYFLLLILSFIVFKIGKELWKAIRYSL